MTIWRLAAADVWRTMVMTDNNFAHADTTYYTYVNNVFAGHKATKTPSASNNKNKGTKSKPKLKPKPKPKQKQKHKSNR